MIDPKRFVRVSYLDGDQPHTLYSLVLDPDQAALERGLAALRAESPDVWITEVAVVRMGAEGPESDEVIEVLTLERHTP